MAALAMTPASSSTAPASASRRRFVLSQHIEMIDGVADVAIAAHEEVADRSARR
jgi:hypothetical protein